MCSSAWERKDEQCHWFKFTYIVFLFGLQSIYRWPEAGCWSEASSTAEWDRQCYTGHVLRQGRRGHQKPGRPGGGQVLGKVKVRHVKCSIHSFYEDLVHSLCENLNFFFADQSQVQCGLNSVCRESMILLFTLYWWILCKILNIV